MTDVLSGNGVGAADLGAPARQRPRKVEGRVRVRNWVPGTAIVHMGEPTATELALLRFEMTESERASVNEIVQRIASRHQALHEKGQAAVDRHIKAIVKVIKEQGRATPIVEVWDDVPDNGHLPNGNGAHHDKRR